jgi:hypothetical protein
VSYFPQTRHPVVISYLAGLLEGEGSFLRPPPSLPNQSAIALAMTDEDVVVRAAVLIETTYCEVGRTQAHHKRAYVARVRGQRAVEVMEALHPTMGLRRREQIERALAARALVARRRPYATEVAEMVRLKAAGQGRQQISQRFGISAKAVDTLLRPTAATRSVRTVLAEAEQVKHAEDAVVAAVGGDPDLAWLAGLLEGEGSFSRYQVQLRMTDEDVVRRAADLMGATKSPWKEEPRFAHWSPTWCVAVTGRRATDLMMHLTPALGTRRRARIAEVVAPRPKTPRVGHVPADRRARNEEIAQRFAAGESGPELAREFGVTHQNIYYIVSKYKAACLSG